MQAKTSPCSEDIRAAVIGDIHGELDALCVLLSHPALKDRELVFLGDYVNRGPHSREVVDDLIELGRCSPRPVTFLAGNHDLALLRVLDGGPLAPFLAMGGAATILSWVPDVTGDVRTSLDSAMTSDQITFLRNLTSEWACGPFLAVHSPLDVDVRSAKLRSVVIAGHKVTRNLKPQMQGNLILIDTGCGSAPKGRLTALLLPELLYVQSQVRS